MAYHNSSRLSKVGPQIFQFKESTDGAEADNSAATETESEIDEDRFSVVDKWINIDKEINGENYTDVFS